MKYTFTRKQIVNAFNNKILDDDNFLTYLLSTTSKARPMNQKSLDKTKSNWEEQIENIIMDVVQDYSGDSNLTADQATSKVLNIVQSLLQTARKEARGEAIGEVEDELNQLIDKDIAELLGDSFEMFNEERCCKVCGFYPERQRELIFEKLQSLLKN